MTQPKIVCRNVWKLYGPDPQKFLAAHDGNPSVEAVKEAGYIPAVRDASLEVHEGEIVVLMGLSGSGKSTLVRCLSRLIDATAGQVDFDGQDLLATSDKEMIELRRHKMGMVFQHFALFPHRTVGEQREVLEHHAHLVATEFDHLLVRGGQKVLAVEVDLASGGVDQSRKAAHQGRLAGATKTHQDDDLALVDLERCITDGRDVTGLLDRFDRWVPIVGGKELLRVGSVQLPDVPADDLGLGHRFGPRSDGRPADSCVRKLGWKSDWPVAEGVGPGNRPDTTTPSGTVP